MFWWEDSVQRQRALKAGIILLSISFEYKRNVTVTCMKNVISPFESGGGLSMALVFCIIDP